MKYSRARPTGNLRLSSAPSNLHASSARSGAATFCCLHSPTAASAHEPFLPSCSQTRESQDRSSTGLIKTDRFALHLGNSRNDRRPWSQRFPQRRPHKRCKPTRPAEYSDTAHNVLGTTVLPTPNRSAAPQEQQRAVPASKQFPTRGFQSLERPGKENTPNALFARAGRAAPDRRRGAAGGALPPPLAPRGAPGPGAPPAICGGNVRRRLCR